MSRRWTWVGRAILAAFAASAAASLLLAAANGSFGDEESLSDAVALMLAFAAFMVVGVLVVAHRPGNAVGAAWWASWTWYPTVILALVFTPLLFPTGRLLSPRWRLVAWPAAAVTAACVTRSTWTPCRPSCWPWSTTPSSRPGRRCGCAPSRPPGRR